MMRNDFVTKLFGMTNEALYSLVSDIRAQVNSGLMSSKEAHEQINLISAVILTKDIEQSEESYGQEF
jgi:hypothetical protein